MADTTETAEGQRAETPPSATSPTTEKMGIESVRSALAHETASDAGKLPFTKQLCFKLDLWLLTPMFFLNFLSLMGRTNIGNALIQELPTDLHLTAMKIFIVTVMPLVMLILFEIPSNLLMRWLERNWGLSYMRYLSLITVGLGIVTLGQAFDQSYNALVGTRFVVGIFDAGLIPGCVFVLSLYYPGVHLQWRMSMLMVANIVSNIVSNILAYGIAQIHNSNGYHGWRWIFIVEGALTMGIGLACCAFNISRPETAFFLTEEDKEAIAQNVESRTTTIGMVAEWKIFFSNILNYVWASLYVFTCATTYSVAIFAPTFVQVFHSTYTVPQVQGQVVPIFVVSAAACLLTAWLADRYNHRSTFAMIGYLITIIGYAILLTAPTKPSVSMLGLYFVSIGTYSSLPMVWTLTCINLATPLQKAIGCGFVVGMGNIGGFISAWIFRTSQKPKYHAGMTDGLILTCVAFFLTGLAWLYITMHNKKKTSSDDKAESGAKVFLYRA